MLNHDERKKACDQVVDELGYAICWKGILSVSLSALNIVLTNSEFGPNGRLVTQDEFEKFRNTLKTVGCNEETLKYCGLTDIRQCRTLTKTEFYRIEEDFIAIPDSIEHRARNSRLASSGTRRWGDHLG